MTLGDKSALSRELRDTYSVTGASHVLALSGLHLGILYMLLSFLLQSRYRQRVWSQAVLVLSIWAFALLVGLPVSVVRSATMISLFAIFSVGHRPHLSVNLLCLAALVILLQNPYALFDVGFQLSFVSVASILLLLPLFTPDPLPQAERAPAPSLFRRFTTSVVGLLAVSLVAQVGVAPLIAYYFGRFSTYFLLTNLIVIPAVTVILYGSLLFFISSWTAIGMGVLWIVTMLNRVLEWTARLPMASIDGLHPSAFQVVLIYVVFAALYLFLVKLRPIAKD
jgi:competence protein ComEC